MRIQACTPDNPLPDTPPGHFPNEKLTPGKFPLPNKGPGHPQKHSDISPVKN